MGSKRGGKGKDDESFADGESLFDSAHVLFSTGERSGAPLPDPLLFAWGGSAPQLPPLTSASGFPVPYLTHTTPKYSKLVVFLEGRQR